MLLFMQSAVDGAEVYFAPFLCTPGFAPVAKMDSITIVLAIAAAQQWEVHPLDVKSAPYFFMQISS